MKQRHNGFALLVMLTIIMMMSAVMLSSGLRNTNERLDARARRETLRDLRDAELALLTHGLVEDSTPGTLPRPSDVDSINGDYAGSASGASSTSSTSSSGSGSGFAGTPPDAARRLPWKFLGLQPPQGRRECLWYVVAENYRNSLSASTRNTADERINPDNLTGLNIYLHGIAEPRKAAAIVFAPGPALASQSRTTSAFPDCTAGNVPAFLDTAFTISNASGAGSFVTANEEDGFNDQLRIIHKDALLRHVLSRVLVSLSHPSAVSMLRGRIDDAAGDGHLGILRFQGPQTPARNAETFDLEIDATAEAPAAGANPLLCPRSSTPDWAYKKAVSWLCFNDWYSHIDYRKADRTLNLSLDRANPAARYCRLNLDTGHLFCEN